MTRPTPHSYRQWRPQGREYDPPGWTHHGRRHHARAHRRTVEFLQVVAAGRLMAGPAQRELDARARELARLGATVAEGVAAVEEAMTELLALPWLADADTRPIARQDAS